MGASSRYKFKLTTLVLTAFLWELASFAAGAKYFPHLWMVIPDLFLVSIKFTFWQNLGVTLWLSILALFFGTICATIFGVAIALKKSGESATKGFVNFLRSMPSLVLLPLLIASIGSSAQTAVLLGTFVVTFQLIIYVIRGVRQTEPRLIDAVKIISMPAYSRILFLYLPSTISITGTGIRLSASRAFGTIIAAGILAGTPGLGSSLLLAESSANYPRVFSYVIVMGITGSLIYNIFGKIEKKFVHWRVSI